MDDLLNEIPTKTNKAAIGFIFITLLLDVIGFGIIIPVMPTLIAQLKGISITETSKYGGYLLSSFAVAQFIFSPIMGALSDKYGRRPVLLISLAGLSIDYLLLAFAPTYAWLIVGRILAGITGASFTTATAYIADVSNDSNRAKNFGMIGAAFGLGFVLGPIIGGLLGQYNPKWPFYASAVLCLLNLLYGIFILPESLSKENRRNINITKINPINTVLKLGKYENIGWLMLAFFFLYFGSNAVQSNWSYYTQYVFNWSSSQIGLSLGLVGVLVGLVQAVFVKKAISIFGENKTVYIGFTLYAVGMFLFAIATQGWMMLLFLIPYCAGGISGPAIQSIMSARVPSSEQGELQGGLTSLQSLTTIFGPLVMTGIFDHVITPGNKFNFVGSPFLLGGILMAISAFVSYYALNARKTT
jgi:MFS transporter, DHA1 family, tetracycline resistance protein